MVDPKHLGQLGHNKGNHDGLPKILILIALVGFSFGALREKINSKQDQIYISTLPCSSHMENRGHDQDTEVQCRFRLVVGYIHNPLRFLGRFRCISHDPYRISKMNVGCGMRGKVEAPARMWDVSRLCCRLRIWLCDKLSLTLATVSKLTISSVEPNRTAPPSGYAFIYPTYQVFWSLKLVAVDFAIVYSWLSSLQSHSSTQLHELPPKPCSNGSVFCLQYLQYPINRWSLPFGWVAVQVPVEILSREFTPQELPARSSSGSIYWEPTSATDCESILEVSVGPKSLRQETDTKYIPRAWRRVRFNCWFEIGTTKCCRPQ